APTPPTLLLPPLSDKLALVTHHHLLTRVPVKLDLDNWNYESWEFFFEQLCSSYDVEKYIHSSTNESSTSTLAPLIMEGLKVDKIVLSWIFTTLSDALQARSRTNALKAELRSIKLGDQSMKSYFQKIESIVTILTSLDFHVNDDGVVDYALEGLPDKYNQVCGYMHNKDSFPDLKSARSLLITEEMRLKSKALALPVYSSSSMVLLAESGNNRRSSITPQVKSWRPCFTFAKGACQFGDLCQYVHDANARTGNNSNGSNTRGRETIDNTNTTNEFLTKLLQQLGTIGITCTTATSKHTSTPTIAAFHTGLPNLVGPTAGPLPPLGFPPQAQYTPQAYARPNTPAAYHYTIFSVKDFTTRLVLLQYDSTGDLYPVTSPSPIPQAYLASQHTWHQRLGHSGSEVLCRLISFSFISDNKEKPPVLCHACQLGKHVRLPFVKFETVISSCFDIIHSDYKYEIESFQCDHGGEFDNRALHKLFADNGIRTTQIQTTPKYNFLDDSPDLRASGVVTR
nr:ribonuclease H-like domain-containing protein [Tanacetum cinerariifolium]